MRTVGLYYVVTAFFIYGIFRLTGSPEELSILVMFVWICLMSSKQK